MNKEITKTDKANKADKMMTILEVERASRLHLQNQLMQISRALIRQGLGEEDKYVYLQAYSNQILMETKRALEAVTNETEIQSLMNSRKIEVGEGNEITDDTYCNLQNALIGIRKTV